MGLQISKQRGYTYPVSGGISNPASNAKILFFWRNFHHFWVQKLIVKSAKTKCKGCKNPILGCKNHMFGVQKSQFWGAKITASGCKNLLLLVQKFLLFCAVPKRFFFFFHDCVLRPLRKEKCTIHFCLQTQRLQKCQQIGAKTCKIFVCFAPIFPIFAPILIFPVFAPVFAPD